MAVDKSKIEGISGWLYLFAFSLVIGVPYQIYSILNDIVSAKDLPAGIFLAVMIVDLVILLSFFFLVYTFFTKNWRFKRSYFVFTGLVLFVNWATFYMTNEPNDGKAALKATFTALVWSLYIIRSHRVRNTFRRAEELVRSEPVFTGSNTKMEIAQEMSK